MLQNPKLLLLDEPFSALDYQTRLMVSSDICQLIRKAGKTMIIVTHDLSEAISLADKVYVLSAHPAGQFSTRRQKRPGISILFQTTLGGINR